MSLYITQQTNNDCAITSYKILMANLFQNEKYLHFKPSFKKNRYSLYDLIELAKENQVKLIGIQVLDKYTFDLMVIDNSFIAEFELMNNEKHLVVVKKVSKNSVLIYDPAQGIYNLKTEEFLHMWNGIALIVQNFEKRRLIEMKKIKKDKMSISKFTSICSQILSSVSIFLGFYYLNDRTNFIIPLVCFLSYFLFFILGNFLSKKDLKEIDIKVLKRNNLSYYLRTNFEKITRYKMLSKINITTFINNVLLVAGLGVILVLNNINNLYIFLGITLLVNVENFLVNKVINRVKGDIRIEENAILTKELSQKALTGYYLKLSYNSHKLYNLLLFKKIISSILIFLSCFILMIVEGYSAFNFLMFYFVAFEIVHDKLNEIFEFPSKIKEEQNLKSLINND